MAKAKQAKATKTAPAIRTQEEAELVLSELGTIQRAVKAVELEMNDKMSVLKAKYEAEAQPMNAAIEEKTAMLYDWAEENKALILRDGSKTAKLATGELSWRTTPPAVRFKSADTVVDNLKRLGLERFVRTKEEPNKEAILTEPDAVKGVAGITITQSEMFVAKPFESEIERAIPVKKKA